MAIARRDLLGLGAAVALSATVGACTGTGGDSSAPDRRTSTPSPTTTLRLPPPPGTLYFGASLPYHRSLPAWEQELGSPLAVNRSFFESEPGEVARLLACCRDDVAAGRLPHVSIKPPGSWAAVAGGQHDEWLDGLLSGLGAAAFATILTVHHEPENDARGPGMQAVDFVAMQELVIQRAAELAPRVLVAPILQYWTFEPRRGDVDPSAWVVPGAAAFGLDVYNPWSPTNGKQWRSLGSKVDEAADWIGDKPLVIGEYGCRADPRDPGLAAQWLEDAADYARTHRVLSMCYFNSGLNTPEGTWELSPPMEATFADLLASDWVARPT